jgi:hypothetical protein
MNTPCGHFDVENDALFGVDRSLLFVGRLDPRQTTALSERGVRIRLADPLRFAGRSYLGRWRRRAVQLSQNRISMSLDDRVPGHIGAYECGVEMDNLTSGDPSRYACLYCS